MNNYKKPIVFFLFSLFSFGLFAQTITISGKVTTANDKPITNVVLDLKAGTTTLSTTVDATGNYEFLNVPTDAEISIIPSKEDPHLNGVSTLDFVLAARHILGIGLLDSPDKYIAMDINRSGSITAFDLVMVRRSIIGLDTEFSNNDAWRFVESTQLPDLVVEENDFFENFSNIVNVTGASNVISFNFIGIKIGDANYSANP